MKLTNVAAKEATHLEQSGFDSSIITKITIFNSIEARQQLIADSPIQFIKPFIKYLCSNQFLFPWFKVFRKKLFNNDVDTQFIRAYPFDQVLVTPSLKLKT